MVKTKTFQLPEIQCKKEAPLPHSQTQTNQPCTLVIRGRKYDLSKWADSHPGGPVIRDYHGMDATQIFEAFHGDDAKKLLKSFPSEKDDQSLMGVTSFTEPRSQEILVAFDKLKSDLEKDNLFKLSLGWCAYKTLTTVAFLPLGVFLHLNGYFWLSAICLGIMWQQLGWLAHEYCHHQVFADRKYAKAGGYFLGNVLQGFSRTWWNDRHNSHHASTNVLAVDPDIDNLPLLAWAPSDLDRTSPFWYRVIQYQSYYFLALLPLLRIAWCKESFKFALNMKTSVYSAWRKDASMEVLTLCVHYAWTFWFYLTLPSITWAITWYLVSHLISGFGIAIVVFFNHYSCEKYPQGLAGNFVCLQLFTTRNMTPGLITDWICGGLNYQIEHHLFPTMPRNNLYKCRGKVKQFCQDQGLPYMSSDFFEGLQHVLNFLKSVGGIARARWLKSKKTAARS